MPRVPLWSARAALAADLPQKGGAPDHSDAPCRKQDGPRGSPFEVSILSGTLWALAKSRYPELNDAAWLREQYVELGRSTFHIAEIVGCSQKASRLALVRHAIPTRDKVTATRMPAARRRMRHAARCRVPHKA